MELNSLSMRFVFNAMKEVISVWNDKTKRNKIIPDAPMLVELSGYLYEISSCGGDPEIDGFVVCCKTDPVGQWVGMEYVNLKAQNDQ